MTTVSFGKPALIPLAAAALAGLLVAAGAWALGQAEAARYALAGVGVAWLVAIVSELAAGPATASLPNGQVLRMLLTMLLRAAGVVAALLVAIKGYGCEPRTVALVALPIYLGLLVGEAVGLVATQRAATHRAVSTAVKTGSQG